MEDIISMIVANGLWAALFCFLLAYELKDSRRRERRYVETIDVLGERLGELKSVKCDTEKIADGVEKLIECVGCESSTDDIEPKSTVCTVKGGVSCIQSA